MIPLAVLADGIYAVLGLGSSGTAAAKALLAAGKTVWTWDDDPTIRARADSLGLPIVDLCRADFRSATALVLSPGIPHTWPEPNPIVARARKAGCPVIGDGELLARAVADAIFVGITGTNGKSTTTALIGHILQTAGHACAVGGNLGRPVLDLPPQDAKSAYVLEMSSYQLELTPHLVFNVSVLLNISPDHLERHGGMEGYIAAKRAIFRGCRSPAAAIVGADDEPCRRIGRALAEGGERRVILISGRQPLAGGIFARNGILFDDLGGRTQPVLDLTAAEALPGEHNAQNAAAAYAAVRALGVEPAAATQAIRSFPGLAHRQERIAVIRGVAFVNDSKATNADAAARALACYSTIYWIAGGRAKQGGLEPVEPYLPRVRRAFLIGEAEGAFSRALAGHVEVSRCGTLDRAVEAAVSQAFREALPDSVVLLSPACASFDQFENFEARGRTFRALVEAIEP